MDEENQQGVMVTNVANDNINIVSLLLGQKADANSEIIGTTPLVVAAGNSSLEMVDLLVTSGANVNKPNPKQITPLISACLTGRREVVKYLLEKDAKVNSQTPDGLSAIQGAVLRNDPEMIDLLLSYGVDIEMTSETGITPFWLAAGLGYRESMIALLDAGARCDLDQKSAIDLMELAFRYDMPEAVKLALDAGKELVDLELGTFRALSPLIDDDVFDILTLEGSVASRNLFGGTAPEQVRVQITDARRRIAE